MPSSRRVRFSPKMRLVYIPSLSEMDSSTLASCHYSEIDFESMQHDTVQTIRAMRAGPLNEKEDTEMTSRGLESLQSRASVECKKKNRQNVTDAVLDEQERQWSCGKDDDEKIASASRAFSKLAVRQALHLAASDAKFVRSMVHTEEAAQQQRRRSNHRTQSVLKKAQEVIAANLASEAKKTTKTTTTRPARRHSVTMDMTLLRLVVDNSREQNPQAMNNHKVLAVRSASIPGTTLQEENDLIKNSSSTEWNIPSQQKQQQQGHQRRTTLQSILARR